MINKNTNNTYIKILMCSYYNLMYMYFYHLYTCERTSKHINKHIKPIRLPCSSSASS